MNPPPQQTGKQMHTPPNNRGNHHHPYQQQQQQHNPNNQNRNSGMMGRGPRIPKQQQDGSTQQPQGGIAAALAQNPSLGDKNYHHHHNQQQQMTSFPVGQANNTDEGPIMPNFIQQPQSKMVFDGKRMRKAIDRQFIDYNPTVIQLMRTRLYERSKHDFQYIPPNPAYEINLLPPSSIRQNPTTCIATKFEHASINKMKCPIHVVCWTPDGRRLLTGASTGEFTLWNGMAFNFETIQQAHDVAIRAMVWNHNDTFMASADNSGVIKYWQPNMNGVKTIKGHEECIRDLGFAPSDSKFCSCSDDGTVKVWDFERAAVEKTLSGHSSDVRCCDWHPRNSLIASGAKDYLVKLWDARSGKNVATLYGHKNTIFNIKWNMNGNWVLSCSKDQLIKLYDIRYLKEFQTFKGHNREVTCLAWHPYHENLFSSGSYDGNIMFWVVGNKSPQAKIKDAHANAVWDLAWHPFGHVLCSGSNDYSTKFWVRNRPGDKMDDKYNVHELPADAQQLLQSMGNQQKTQQQVHKEETHISDHATTTSDLFTSGILPGLGSTSSSLPGLGFGSSSSSLPGL
ncbi:hypothetical protein FDP41_006742 [Naegleria fowleri]|uniref:Uncharacterized protein n=1 Tax=Naegleria fowleri TaxID=5763 RepID=A0A6A5BH49_NAEFO|nr:uncharacterized protein FDP41_006742 [Naegleria fowleri]KAF0974132.1 hypothetical protein FDP41_006742 [Naegleria fowleri]CAG4717617.1 unnamed protein product [Naegleria fowleri]